MSRVSVYPKPGSSSQDHNLCHGLLKTSPDNGHGQAPDFRNRHVAGLRIQIIFDSGSRAIRS